MSHTHPLIVGIGGTMTSNSSSERLMRHVLAQCAAAGAETLCFDGTALDLPMYGYGTPRTAKAVALTDKGAVLFQGEASDVALLERAFSRADAAYI